MEINKIADKIDLISSKYNIISNSNKKSYTLDDFNTSLNKLEKLIQNKNLTPDENIYLQSIKSIKSSKSIPLMETLVYHLENQLSINKNSAIDNMIDSIIESIINCIPTESTEIKKSCANKIKIIVNENYFKPNIKNKLLLLVNLIINSK
jgi:hypothetical protein